ncbi:MAG: type III pantothenate kinase [Gammaproteobacteria bacterium]|nr:type III pantothenate kinase [Gammaproteobacteria bacterium]
MDENFRRLLVDVGNTNVKWGLSGPEGMGQAQSAEWRGGIEQLMDQQWSLYVAPDEVWVSNVTGTSLESRLVDWSNRHWQLTPHFVRSESQASGVINGYTDPSQLGVDRWLALIAAHSNIEGALCVVDCGTATTVDMVTDRGEHLGGMILPGFDLMRMALKQNTLIPEVERAKAEGMLGNSTASCITLGTSHTTGALVERVVRKYSQSLQTNVQLVLTGSGSTRLSAVLETQYHHVPNLVLEGLNILAAQGCS